MVPGVGLQVEGRRPTGRLGNLGHVAGRVLGDIRAGGIDFRQLVGSISEPVPLSCPPT